MGVRSFGMRAPGRARARAAGKAFRLRVRCVQWMRPVAMRISRPAPGYKGGVAPLGRYLVMTYVTARPRMKVVAP